MMRSLFSSLRTRLVLLVLLALLPVFGLAFYDRYDQRERNARAMQSQALELTRRAMNEQLELIGAAHQLLFPLTQLAVVRGEGPITCAVFFTELLAQNSIYSNLGVIDARGDVVCAGSAPAAPVNVGARPYFAHVLQQQVMFGDFEIGVISSAPTINIAFPIVDDAQQTRGAVFASLDLAWFRWFAEREKMPQGSTIVLLGRASALGMRYPETHAFDVAAFATSRVAQWSAAQAAQRIIEFGDPDGVNRLYAFAPLGSAESIGIGIPSVVAYEEVDRRATRDLQILLLVTGAALATAWIFGDWFVVKRVQALRRATQRLTGGDLSARTEQSYGASELSDLARAFDQMAATIQRRAEQQKDSEEALLQQTKELAAITRLSREVTLVLDLNQVLESIARVTAQLSKSDASGVYMPDTQGVLRLAAGYGVSAAFVEALNAIGIRSGEGAIGRAEAEQHPVQLHDMNVGYEYPFTSIFQTEGLRAVLAVPMIRSGHSVGGIVLWHRKPRHFTVSEVAFLQAIAQQCVNAVENARLMQAEHDARELAEALRDTAAALSSTLDFDKLLDRILDIVKRVVPHDSANIMLIEQGCARVVRARAHSTLNSYALDKRLVISETPHLRRMLETGLARAIPDAEKDAEWIDFPETRWIRSNLGAPIQMKGQVIGFLSLDSATPGFYTAAHIPRLQAFADQAALALENARLLAETGARASIFAALHETAQVIAVQQDLPALFETIVKRAMMLLGVSHCGLYLYDASRHDLELVVQEGLGMSPGVHLRLGEGMAGRVAQTHQPLIVSDYSHWEHRAPQFGGVPFSAVLQVPLLHRGELIGVLSVAEIGATTRRFNDEDARLLDLFASQVAGAVYNARLLQETHTRAEQLTLLYDAGLALNSILEPRAQLEYLLKIAMRALHGDRAVFFRYDARQNSVHLEVCLDYPEELQAATRQLDTRLGDEQTVIGWVATNRLPLHLPDVSADPRYQTVDPGIRAGLWMPVEHERQLLGVVGVLSMRPAAFRAADERLLALFANQAAVALENARLFAETRRRLTELEAVREF
jgi:GAF domain-containing protein